MEVYILFMLLLLSGPLYLNDSSLEYGYSMHPTSTWMLSTKQQTHHLKCLKCPISYYKNSSATFHLELLISGDINPNPGPETLINTPTNATQLHEISYSRNELLNLRNAPFTDVTALSYSALSQINCFGILANRPQTYRPTHRGKKAGRRDFNVHMDNTLNIYADQFKDLLSAHGLIQHITAPTHRYGHCLDLMITRENTSPLISNITVHPGLSDHYAIITDMNLKKPKMPTISVSTRHWKNVNIQDLCFDIESQLEKVNLEDGELDSCVNLFESTVRNILDDHAPLIWISLVQWRYSCCKENPPSTWAKMAWQWEAWSTSARVSKTTWYCQEHNEPGKNSSLLITCRRELWKSEKNSLTLLKSCYINPKLECFHLHTLIRTSQMHFQTFLLQSLCDLVANYLYHNPFNDVITFQKSSRLKVEVNNYKK